MRHLSILLCLVCTVLYAQECEYNINGVIKDFHDGSVIQDATVYIEQLNTYTTSNTNGVFTFTNLCKGNYTLVISHLNCETKRVEIILNDSKVIDVLMEHHIEELSEVSVKSKERKLTKSGQETLIKNETIQKYSSSSLGDLLKEVSGVSSINTGNSIVKPMINGFHSSRVLIFNNSVRLQDQEWGVEHAPNIDINSANQIAVIKGSGALAYGGDAIGGVIVLNPSRVILKDTLYGNTILGGQTNGRGISISSTLTKNYQSGWFGQVQGSYKRNGDFKAPDYYLTNTGIDSKGLSARFGKAKFESGFEVYYSYLNSEIAILRASHIGSTFDLERAINSGQPIIIDDFSYDINEPKQDITHHLAKASFYKRFQNFGKVRVQYDYQHNQRFEFDVRIGERRKTPAVDLRLQTHTITADVNLDSNINRKINFGILGRFQDNFANPDTGVNRLIPDYVKYDFGLYSTVEWQLNYKFTLDAGLRYDFNRVDAKKFYARTRWEERNYNLDFQDIIIGSVFGTEVLLGVIDPNASEYLTNPVFNYHNISASVGGKFNINDKNEMLLNYSLASRPPNPSELFSDGLHHSAARFELGDLRFDKEISNRISASYSYTDTKFKFLSEFFYSRITDFIYLRPFDFILTNRGPFPLWEYQQTDAEMFGLDITANYSLSKSFEWQNKTAFIKGYDLETDLALIDIPPFNTMNQITYRNESWYNFSASLKSEWFFEQNEYPNFNFEIEDELTGEMKLVDISTPPPAYHLIHFASSATFSLGNNTSLDVRFGINNLFNTSYRNYLNRLRFFADELGRNITLQVQLNY